MRHPSVSNEEFVEFYTAQRDRCLRAAIAWGMDPHRAEESVAEAFSRAWARWRTVSTMQAPAAWVVRTAINQDISSWRRHGREIPSEVVPRLSPAPGSTASLDPSDSLDLIAAIRRLPARQREVVAMRYLLDLDTQTVARTLRIAPGTVSAHLHHALATLRAHVDLPEGITS